MQEDGNTQISYVFFHNVFMLFLLTILLPTLPLLTLLLIVLLLLLLLLSLQGLRLLNISICELPVFVLPVSDGQLWRNTVAEKERPVSSAAFNIHTLTAENCTSWGPRQTKGLLR